MIKLKKWMMNPCQTACHVLSDESGEAIIIDACAYYPKERENLIKYIENENLKPVHNLLTHGHFDHLLCNDLIRDNYGLLPEVHKGDATIIAMARERINEVLGESNFTYDIPMPEHYLEDDERITFGNHSLRVIHTPGHSPGSCFFYCEDGGFAFSGDTLFAMSIGRSDLPGGSKEQLTNSLKYILDYFPEETVIYPGHTKKTTIGHEKACNPYLT